MRLSFIAGLLTSASIMTMALAAKSPEVTGELTSAKLISQRLLGRGKTSSLGKDASTQETQQNTLSEVGPFAAVLEGLVQKETPKAPQTLDTHQQRLSLKGGTGEGGGPSGKAKSGGGRSRETVSYGPGLSLGAGQNKSIEGTDTVSSRGSGIPTSLIATEPKPLPESALRAPAQGSASSVPSSTPTGGHPGISSPSMTGAGGGLEPVSEGPASVSVGSGGGADVPSLPSSLSGGAGSTVATAEQKQAQTLKEGLLTKLENLDQSLEQQLKDKSIHGVTANELQKRREDLKKVRANLRQSSAVKATDLEGLTKVIRNLAGMNVSSSDVKELTTLVNRLSTITVPGSKTTPLGEVPAPDLDVPTAEAQKTAPALRGISTAKSTQNAPRGREGPSGVKPQGEKPVTSSVPSVKKEEVPLAPVVDQTISQDVVRAAQVLGFDLNKTYSDMAAASKDLTQQFNKKTFQNQKTMEGIDPERDLQGYMRLAQEFEDLNRFQQELRQYLNGRYARTQKSMKTVKATDLKGMIEEASGLAAPVVKREPTRQELEQELRDLQRSITTFERQERDAIQASEYHLAKDLRRQIQENKDKKIETQNRLADLFAKEKGKKSTAQGTSGVMQGQVQTLAQKVQQAEQYFNTTHPELRRFLDLLEDKDKPKLQARKMTAIYDLDSGHYLKEKKLGAMVERQEGVVDTLEHMTPVQRDRLFGYVEALEPPSRFAALHYLPNYVDVANYKFPDLPQQVKPKAPVKTPPSPQKQEEPQLSVKELHERLKMKIPLVKKEDKNIP